MYIDRETVATARDLIERIDALLHLAGSHATGSRDVITIFNAIDSARGYLDRLRSMFPVPDSAPDTVRETTDASGGSDDFSRQIRDLDRQLANVAVIQGLVAKYFAQPDPKNETDQKDG